MVFPDIKINLCRKQEIRNLQLMTTLIKTKIRFIKFFVAGINNIYYVYNRLESLQYYHFYALVIFHCFLKENLKLHLKLISIELSFITPHGHFTVILFSPDCFCLNWWIDKNRKYCCFARQKKMRQAKYIYSLMLQTIETGDKINLHRGKINVRE